MSEQQLVKLDGVEVGIDEEATIEVEIIESAELESSSEQSLDGDAGESEGTEDEDEELRNISKNVKKRIDKLTWKYNEERRKAESATLMQEEAIRFAEQQRRENHDMRQIMDKGEQVLMAEIRSRTNSDVDIAQQSHKSALESGDSDEISKAQMVLNRAQMEQYTAESYRATPQQQQQVQPAPQAARAPVVDADFEKWKESNTWFDSDSKMRAYAEAVHKDIKDSPPGTGVIVGSVEYYSQIDSTMKSAFPGFFGVKGKSEPAAGPPPSVVAPTSRNNSGKSPRKVQLTDTAAALANRLGIPVEVYALEQQKLENANE